MVIGLRGRYHYGAFFIIPNWEGDLAFILVRKAAPKVSVFELLTAESARGVQSAHP